MGTLQQVTTDRLRWPAWCRQSTFTAVLLLVLASGGEGGAQNVAVRNEPGSLKFAAIGDNGTGKRPQYEMAETMRVVHQRFPYELVIMLGDNFYGRQRPRDLVDKFEKPYAPLLAAGVKFYASLGNHDNPSTLNYPPINMGGQRYYTYVRKNVRFFVLDTNVLDERQLAWAEQELSRSQDDWKIAYFHHPIYSSAGRHGSDTELRVILEPLFVKYGVDIVFQGHDHAYERVKPQKGITYFVSGAGGQLREGDIDPTDITAAEFDQDRSFMVIEVMGDEMRFESVARTGRVVDSGIIRRQP
jgi:predicted MPP superfamily phosphohydrolase